MCPLRHTPPSVTDARPDLPSDLARIIRRCLEKDPSHRVQTARDVSNEFRDLARQTSQKLAAATTSTSSSRAVPAADSGIPHPDEVSGVKRHAIALTIAAFLLVIGFPGPAFYLHDSMPGPADSTPAFPLH